MNTFNSNKMGNYRKEEYKSKATAFNGVYKALQGNKNFDVRDTKTQQGVIETNKVMKSFLESSGVKPEKSHTKNAELVHERFSEFRNYITGSDDDDDNDSNNSCNSCSTVSNENQSILMMTMTMIVLIGL